MDLLSKESSKADRGRRPCLSQRHTDGARDKVHSMVLVHRSQCSGHCNRVDTQSLGLWKPAREARSSSAASRGEASQPRLAMNYSVTEIEEMSKSHVIFPNLGTN